MIVAGLSNFGAESYERHRDATALAAGLAGELRGYLPDFPEMLRILPRMQQVAARGHLVELPKIERPTSPVFEKGVEKLGVLGVDLAERVSFVYATIEAFRSLMAAATTPGVTPREQSMALLAATDSLRRLEPAAEVVDALHRFAKREWLQPFE